ncbi:GspH/FimT family pseudopilin [Oceanicoccus sagamiensis]|uniref:Type II secretion system protein H n=1 Tax=Oceanicoccus sagamiensis TaxID=716816 RepID=A0A1X9NBA7_9GAMM|nr:GspH/FimT family pseudopilin [Oceanicoccus sagamiensis]ARN72829.1 hypothetical protein BST96_01135 [Oceanicoccus sagamiensis]
MSLPMQISRNSSSQRQRGFTLVELMMTLAVAAIIMGVVLPGFNNLIQRTQMAADFNQLLGDLAYARSEAVKANIAVSICPTADQSTCSGTDWTKDWLIFTDNDSNRDRDGADTILRVRQASSSDITITLSDFAEDGGIRFEGDGKFEDADSASVGQMVVCDDRGATSAQGLSFSVYGQFRLMRDTNDSGVVDYIDDDGNSKDVTCPAEEG